MAFHCCPLKGYEFNLEKLAQYVSVFDGVKVVGLAYLPHTDTKKVSAKIKDYLGANTKIILVKNDPFFREAVTFLPIMAELEKRIGTEKSMVWYGHSKGITHTKPAYAEVTRLWAAACYYYTLSPDYLEKARQAIESGFAIAGPFRRVGLQKNFPKQPVDRFHFSGTFFWFDPQRLFKKGWQREFSLHRYGVEALPGAYFKEKESACLYGDRVKDLYKPESWKKLLKPELIKELLKHG